MKLQALTCLAAVSVLAGCSGGGGSNTPQAFSPQSLHQVSGTLTLSLPTTTSASIMKNASATRRTPSYISPGTTNATLFIDGATGNAGGTACNTSHLCTIMWSAKLSTPASHSFAVVLDDGSHVLGEGVAPYTIANGANGNLAPLVLNGVAASLTYTLTSCPTTSTCDGNVTIADAGNNAIVYSGTSMTPVPGNEFDNTSVTFTSDTAVNGTVSGIAQAPNSTYTTGSLAVAEVNATGIYTYSVSCVAAASGNFGISAVTGARPAGYVTAAELVNVTHSPTYPSLTVQPTAPSFTCANGLLETATGSLPIQ